MLYRSSFLIQMEVKDLKKIPLQISSERRTRKQTTEVIYLFIYCGNNIFLLLREITANVLVLQPIKLFLRNRVWKIDPLRFPVEGVDAILFFSIVLRPNNFLVFKKSGVCPWPIEQELKHSKWENLASICPHFPNFFNNEFRDYLRKKWFNIYFKVSNFMISKELLLFAGLFFQIRCLLFNDVYRLLSK